jgi:hypothetical protein
MPKREHANAEVLAIAQAQATPVLVPDQELIGRPTVQVVTLEKRVSTRVIYRDDATRTEELLKWLLQLARTKYKTL